jgi:2-iminobutanoate/2-iminopropanoate deaminase
MNEEPDAIFHPSVSLPGAPFSEAVHAGGLLYLSGQVGLDASGRLASGGIAAETRQTLANVAAVLERHGSSLERVVKVTVLMADVQEWAAMNTEYVKAFTRNLPARSAFGVSGLPLGARVEIECVALAPVEAGRHG